MDWSQLLEAHGRIVWKTVYRLVNDEAAAADCFQETFVAAFQYSRSHSIQNWPGLLKRLGPPDWVQTGFVFDEKLDTALFSTTPPADYQVET
jgi:hypothetical protein